MNTLITILSLVVAILAWVAKLKWSKEYRAAKDAVIESKDANIELLKDQINLLKDFTPSKMREHYLGMKVQLEEYNEVIQSQLSEAKNVIGMKEAKISELQSQGEEREGETSDLIKSKEEIESKLEKLQKLVGGLNQDSVRIPVFSANKIDTIEVASKNLSESMVPTALDFINDIQRQSASMRDVAIYGYVPANFNLYNRSVEYPDAASPGTIIARDEEE